LDPGGWGWGGEGDLLAGGGVSEGEFAGVEAEVVGWTFWVVEGVSDDGVAGVEAVEAGLVGAAGFEEDAEPSARVVSVETENFEFRPGDFAAR